MPRQGADTKPLSSTVLRCAFVGGDECGGFTGEQLRYPCKLRRHICARCGMHRGEHGCSRPNAGIWDEHLPPRKRSVFRRLGEFQPLDLGGGEDEDKTEGQTWTPGDAMAKGKRAARRRRASWCEL
ncbi:hypothetical protein BDA96_04G335900 [Sorghum bicolor]|uniref:Uncharacterized protein n=2 Tax=Sorghum bicolor TaxID=4558 RepID=A0A921R800_SORBI|nr:hypothetical protein SORBI_3004G313800 [Sorghum bicolor]KAG0535082.1 hypothetical protein BDA96_04G335900 [Sorghum bicolor]